MGTVLAVDRNPETISAVIAALSSAIPGTSVVNVGSAAEAARELAGNGCDFVVVNRESLGEEAMEICRNLKKDACTRNLPVIMLVAGEGGAAASMPTSSTSCADVLMTLPINEKDIADQARAFHRAAAGGDLASENRALRRILGEKIRSLRERTYEHDKRVKELNCLYGISELRERPGITIEGILQGVAELIPPSWQYPEITCARVIMGYQEFKTSNFRETPWKQSCDIHVHGEWAGKLEVYYLECPESGKMPFLEQEDYLLGAIAERLGKIAERVQAEEALRVERDNILSILMSMDDGVYKVSDQFVIEYTNPALEREFGPLDGRLCYNYFKGRSTPCEECMLDRVVVGRGKVRREWFFQCNGRTYDVVSTPLTNADGSVSKLSILRDVSALVKAQKALEERERLYRSVTEFIADGAVMVQEGLILFANHSFTEMFEYGIDELRGMRTTDLFAVEFRDLFRRVFDPGEQDETLGGALRGVCVRKSGREFWVSVHRSLIDLKNKPAILATMRDVTEEVHWEMSIQEESEYLRRENIKLKSSIKERYKFGRIVGKSPPMQKVYELILKAAGSDVNVLILGESGTGKELVARAVHEMSARAGKPFIPVNCGAIPESLVESEFFGHRRGAFTGAHIDKTGYLESANGGTLFLDEVGELGVNMQVKLLRSFEAGVYTPVGDTQERYSRLRLIAATNRDFNAMVGSGQIRQDFYYRISILPIVLPPLREKKEDIPLLVEHFLRLYFKGKKIPSIPAKVMDMFYMHNWPGNVRELQGVIQRYLAVGNFHFLSPKNMGLKNWEEEEEETLAEQPMQVGELRGALEDFEKRFIKNALDQCRWHRGKTAGLLGVDPKTLYTKMQKLGL
jgi:PAS domain S-box-containing protein